MSAFLCSDRHIYTIVAWAISRKIVSDRWRTASALRSLNNAAMRARYGDGPVSLSRVTDGLEAAAARLDNEFSKHLQVDRYAYALLSCLDYQCVEASGISHPGRSILLKLKLEALQRAGGVMTENVWGI